MRHLSRLLHSAALCALILCVAAVTATAAVTTHGNGNGGSDNSGHGNANDRPASTPSTSAAPTTPPGEPNKPATPPGQSDTKPGATPATPATPGGKGTPATPATPATPPTPGAPTPVPAPVPPALGKSMALEPVSGTVTVRLPQSAGYAPLVAAGSIPSGAVIDARAGTLKLQSAVDAKGRTQTATVRGAIFEVRQSTTGNGMTDLILREGRPNNCPSTTARTSVKAATARAAMTHGMAAKKKAGASGGLWARDRHGRFRSRGRNSVATVRGTRWVTRETCAGTLTRVMDGAVDVFDRHTHRTVRVRAGHSYLAR